MNTPMVSVIVSMYDGEKYIDECIKSILEQEYSNIEVILVDDGSPDNCGVIADRYAAMDSRVSVIHKPNSGVSDSRNQAIEKSCGDYICIVDQDDIISKDYISYLLALCESNKADIALTPSVDKFFDKYHFCNENKDNIRIISGKDAVVEMLYHKYVIAPWNKIINKRLIIDNKIRFNEHFFNGEGFAFSIECLQAANKVVVGSRKVYHYRVGDPSTGASVYNEKNIFSSINAQQYIRRQLKNPDDEELRAWKFSNWHTHCDAFNIMVGSEAKKVNKRLYLYLRKFCKSGALIVFGSPISIQQKLRGIMFKMNPFIAAKIINLFRYRKFKKINL